MSNRERKVSTEELRNIFAAATISLALRFTVGPTTPYLSKNTSTK